MLNHLLRRAGTAVRLSLTIAAMCVAGVSQARQPALPKLVAMPADLETRFALSALPPSMRDGAGVYLLDPSTGYRLLRNSKNGMNCLVVRTDFALVDFRDDIYFPRCDDAEGSRTTLKVVRDVAQMRAQGMSPVALKARVEKLYANKTYKAPQKAGLSYMVGPVMRTLGPPDMKVHTMAMPHLMFYAPGLTNEDIAAKPDIANFSTLMNPFIDRQGNDAQSYMIQMIGETEKANILAQEKSLVDDLCTYRDILCLQSMSMKH